MNTLQRPVLDRASPVPLYYQLAQTMEQAIRSGQLSSGAHLDNEIDLARQLGVSRPTVRRAIGYLAGRGLLIRRRGIGTLVVPVQIRRPIRLTSLFDDLAEAGQSPTTELLKLEMRPASPEVAQSLQVAEATPVQYMERLRFAGNQPIALMHNYLPADIEGITAAGLKETGLYRLLRARGIQLRLASQSIGARTAGRPESQLLKVKPGAALLTMRRIAYDDSGRAVEYGSHVYPAERYAFEMSLVTDSGLG
jgi:DNA-binding GntR family transcriptional regulator